MSEEGDLKREQYVIAISSQFCGALTMACDIIEAVSEDEAHGKALRIARERWPGHHGFLTVVVKLESLLEIIEEIKNE